MAGGMIGLGQDFGTSASRAGDTAIALEDARNREKDMAKGAEKQQRVGMAMSGAAAGATVGSVVPGVGTAIGAGVGFLAGLAGASLF